MNREQAIEIVREVVAQIICDKGEPVMVIDETSVFLGGDLPIDSLDLGAIVVEMERRCDHDPFRDGIINFRTVGELAELYVR